MINKNEILEDETFPLKKLESAYDEDLFYFKGLVEDLKTLL